MGGYGRTCVGAPAGEDRRPPPAGGAAGSGGEHQRRRQVVCVGQHVPRVELQPPRSGAAGARALLALEPVRRRSGQVR
eukprot:6078455-Pyramimonas_sp.AAC.1